MHSLALAGVGRLKCTLISVSRTTGLAVRDSCSPPKRGAEPCQTLGVRLPSCLALLALLLSAACGDDSSPSTPLPECSEVWVEGGEVPEDYQGCREAGSVVRPEFIDCQESDGVVVRYERFIGLLGGEIYGSEQTDTAAMISC